MSDANLEAVFKSFCAFGAGKDKQDMMDSAKFVKLLKDLKIMDKKLTSTDADIIFTKVKGSKSERKITFAQFGEALKQCADKKYPGDSEGLDKLKSKICKGKGPEAHGVTKTVTAGGVDRLTDTSKYTGSHKERFNESGQGKGLDGRKDFDSKAAAGYVGAYKGLLFLTVEGSGSRQSKGES